MQRGQVVLGSELGSGAKHIVRPCKVHKDKAEFGPRRNGQQRLAGRIGLALAAHGQAQFNGRVTLQQPAGQGQADAAVG